jgi:hypothetical protein
MPVPKTRRERAWDRRVRAAVLLFAAASVLGGCASTVADNTPQALGGLPADAPKRPAEPQAYPAVHEVSRPRRDRMLTAEERKKLEEELAAAGARTSAAADATGSTRKP